MRKKSEFKDEDFGGVMDEGTKLNCLKWEGKIVLKVKLSGMGMGPSGLKVRLVDLE